MKIKGNVLLARKEFIETNYGRSIWHRVLLEVPEEDQALFDGHISSYVWYPFEMSQRIDQAIVQVVGAGDKKVFEDIGRASAKRNLSSVHKSFLTPGDPKAFMHRAADIYRFYYDVGQRTYEETSETSGVLSTFGAETYSEADCTTVIGWYKQALEMCGAKNVQMFEETCRAREGEFCRYRVSWELD